MTREVEQIEGTTSTALRLLQGAAYVVLVAWGIRAASHVLSIVLIALLLTYVIAPFPKWLVHRFRLRKSLAIVLTVAFVAAIYLLVSGALLESGLQRTHQRPAPANRRLLECSYGADVQRFIAISAPSRSNIGDSAHSGATKVYREDFD